MKDSSLILKEFLIHYVVCNVKKNQLKRNIGLDFICRKCTIAKTTH